MLINSIQAFDYALPPSSPLALPSTLSTVPPTLTHLGYFSDKRGDTEEEASSLGELATVCFSTKLTKMASSLDSMRGPTPKNISLCHR